MKIGILTLFHENYNWGGVLQGYALKTLIESRFEDVEVDILKYKSGRNVIYSSKLQQALQYSPVEILDKVTQKLKKDKDNSLEVQLKERKQLFKEFMQEMTTNDKNYNDGNLISVAQDYDCLICGSDQIWNPNVARPGYFLEMVNDECTKVSYAASIARNDLSQRERQVMIPLIEHFDFISVREKTAKTFLRKYVSKSTQISEVLDPALMLTAKEWTSICKETKIQEKYALAFFFSESYEYRKYIENYCKKNSLILKFIPYARQEFIETDAQGECERIFNVGPREFIQLFKNANCVFTDSFHGAVFSIIFNKPFSVFERDKNTKVSKNSRLYDLLDKFTLSNRLIRDCNMIERIMNQPINYNGVNERLDKHRERSMKFLQIALSNVKCKKHKELLVTVGDLKKEKCCGCSLCTKLCSKNCITMQSDAEGFTYPKVDMEKCIKCGICLKSCPGIKSNKNSEFYNTYLGFNKNDKVRKESSSGGLFYELAKVILVKKGTVYGATFTNQFTVEHERVDDIKDLNKILKSKYVQSDIQSIYPLMIEDLKNGRDVLFSGTPCQVSAIYTYISKKRLEKNLYLVDFICHGVPSPGIWKSYLNYLKVKNGELNYVNFRDKSHGWHDYYFRTEYKNNSRKGQSHEKDAYMRTFLSDNNLRPSCYECIYKDKTYVSDITLGDAWKVEKDCIEWADDRGTSLFIARTNKGEEILKAVSASFTYKTTEYDRWTRLNPSLVEATHKPVSREGFFNDFINDNSKVFWSKQKKIPVKGKIRYSTKKVLRYTGLEKIARKHL